jgi:signal peptidase I
MNVLKKLWKFLWHDDTPLSWVVSIALSFILVKFLIYPLIGIVFGTGYPIVAVISGSMEHNLDFDEWWNENEELYSELGISKEEFSNFKFKNGFNKGDIMIVVGKESKDINIGDVLIFQSTTTYPVIHRIVNIWEESGEYHFQTKGDNNLDSYNRLKEQDIDEGRAIGVAVLRIPYLGWIKIGFSSLVGGII